MRKKSFEGRLTTASPAYSFGASLAAAARGTFIPPLLLLPAAERPDAPPLLPEEEERLLGACALPPFFSFSLALSACFRIWLALKVSTRRSLILIGSPVWG